MKDVTLSDVSVGNVTIGAFDKLALIAGPCQIEGLDHALRHADAIIKAADKANMGVIYKSSFDKANRSSIDSFRGPGMEEGLKLLEKVSSTFDCPVITDIHEPDQALPVSEICEIIQVPAFLARQTDLVIAAAKTKSIVQFKKPQF